MELVIRYPAATVIMRSQAGREKQSCPYCCSSCLDRVKIICHFLPDYTLKCFLLNMAPLFRIGNSDIRWFFVKVRVFEFSFLVSNSWNDSFYLSAIKYFCLKLNYYVI